MVLSNHVSFAACGERVACRGETNTLRRVVVRLLLRRWWQESWRFMQHYQRHGMRMCVECKDLWCELAPYYTPPVDVETIDEFDPAE